MHLSKWLSDTYNSVYDAYRYILCMQSYFMNYYVSYLQRP